MYIQDILSHLVPDFDKEESSTEQKLELPAVTYLGNFIFSPHFP